MDRLADLVPQSLPNQAVRLLTTDLFFHRPDQGNEDLRLDLGSFEQREFRFIAHAHDRTAVDENLETFGSRSPAEALPPADLRTPALPPVVRGRTQRPGCG